MKTSQNGIDLIKQFEGCRLTAYRCPAGVWTIGYGHTENVKEGQTITQIFAETLLRADLTKYEQKVAKYNRYCWNQNEFDALVSFAYNLGSIDQLTANGTRSREVIAEKMLLYNKAGGKVLNGLRKRREAERKLFLMREDIKEYSLARDGQKQISRNFRVREFRCKDGTDKILIDTNFVKEKLQSIRDYFGEEVIINSGYRTAEWNRKQGGASKSYHLTGQAFDIAISGRTPQEIAKYAQTLGINGIIQYNTFVHVDNRTLRYWARDNNGKVTVKSGF